MPTSPLALPLVACDVMVNPVAPSTYPRVSCAYAADVETIAASVECEDENFAHNRTFPIAEICDRGVGCTRSATKDDR
jgi:hypothetical protein